MIEKSLLKEHIDRWDPIGLFPGCPDDEYSMEIDEIFSVANRQGITADELGKTIYTVFKNSFDSTFSKTKKECINIAKKILLC